MLDEIQRALTSTPTPDPSRPRKRAGAVACLKGVRTPSLVAKAVMEQTDHHLIVGKDAQTFARNMGFKIEDDLNTEQSRKSWIEWKRRTDPLHYLDPIKREAALRQVDREMRAEGFIDPNHFYGTINCNALDARGQMGGVTTTSGPGLALKGEALGLAISLELPLLVIDIQDSFKATSRWEQRNNPRFEENVDRLIQAWRGAGLPVDVGGVAGLAGVAHLLVGADAPARHAVGRELDIEGSGLVAPGALFACPPNQAASLAGTLLNPA